MILSQFILLCLVKVIISKEIYLTIQEELPNGSLVGDFKLYISSEHVNSLRMSNIDPLVNDFFRLESCYLRINKRLDREAVCSQHSKNQDCILKLIVIYGEVQRLMFLSVYVTVTDINDNAPKFSEVEVEHTVVENASPMLSDLFLYQAEDSDRLDNGTITYQLKPDKESQQAQHFRLQLSPDNIPKLTQLAVLDYESQRIYNMELIAFDGGHPSKTGTLKIKIKVKDENDNPPIFEKTKYEETINEDVAINSNVLEVLATDSELDENGRVTYQLAASSTSQQKLSLNYFGVRNYHGKGIVFVKSSIDIDVTPRINSFEFVISACDSGHPPLCSRTTVLIRVVDVNDFRPTIVISYLSSNGRNTVSSVIPENSINNYIAIVTVTDKDSEPGGQVECQLSNPKFELNRGMNDKDPSESYNSRQKFTEQSIYHIKNIKEFDREEIEIVRFKISCKDNPNLQKSPVVITQLTNEADIIVYIEDVNDNAPEFVRNPYEFKILENKPMNEVKMLLGTIEATDKDVNSKFSYKLTDARFQDFELEENGELFLKRSFDREKMRSNPVRIDVMVSDGRFNTTTNVNVHVLDENDMAPVFQDDNYNFQCVENDFSISVGSVEAMDGDSDEFGVIEYKIVPPTPLFSINSRTGLIRVTSRLDREEKDSYSFTIVAIDNAKDRRNRNTGSTRVSILVQDLNDNFPKIIYPQPQKMILIDPQWPVGHKVLSMKATDPDHLENGTLTFSINKDGLGIFNIDPKSGDIFLSRKLTMSENQIITSHLILVVSDNGAPTPKSTTASVSIKITVDNSVDLPDFGSDYSQAGIPQTDKSNRKTLIIIVIVALALIVTVIMTILIIIYQSRMPTQSQLNRNHKRKQAEFNEIQSKNQHFPPSDGKQHFMTSDENFLVPVTNRYFQNSLSLMRQEDNKDINIETLHDSPHLEEYQQLMSTPTLMRIWHNNLSPFSDQVTLDKGTSQHLPSCTTSSGMNPSTNSNDSTNEFHKPHFKEQCSSNNYLQSSFV